VTAQRNRAYSLLKDQYLLPDDKIIMDSVDADRRSLVNDMIGEGYDFSGSKSTFRRHKTLAIASIQKIAGAGNHFKQRQIAEALIQHYQSGGGAEVALGSNEYTAHAAVIEGVVEALDLIKKRNAGRYTTQDRITQEVLLGAAVGVAKGKVLSSVARLLNVRPQTLKKAATRMEATSKDERPSYFFLDEKSCNAYNPAWATFVTECWDSLTTVELTSSQQLLGLTHQLFQNINQCIKSIVSKQQCVKNQLFPNNNVLNQLFPNNNVLNQLFPNNNVLNQLFQFNLRFLMQMCIRCLDQASVQSWQRMV
jgi:hypothetical protein